MAASSLSRVRTYTPSFFLALRANRPGAGYGKIINRL